MREIGIIVGLVIIALIIGAACDPDLDAEMEANAKSEGIEVMWPQDRH